MRSFEEFSEDQQKAKTSYEQWEARQRGERPIVPSGSEAPLCSIVQHETPKFRQLSNNTSITLTTFKGLEDLHKSHDVVMFDHLCDLANPSAAYIAYIDYIKHPGLTFEWNASTNKHDKVSRASEMCKAFVVGYSASRCTDTGNIVYVPKFEAGEYSPYRKAASNRSSANRLASQLCKLPGASDIKDLYLTGMDLTFPKEISLQYTDRPEEAEKMVGKAVKRLIKSLEKEMNLIRNKDTHLGYFFNVHLWHSHDEKSHKEISTPHEPHLHAHVNVVNLVVGKNKEKWSFVRFNPMLDRDVVCECWSNAIFRVCGHYEKNPVFYLHFVPLSSRAQVAHRIRYCGRSPLNDLYNYYQDNDFSEDIPVKYNEFLVDYANRRHPCGFIRGITELVGDVDGDRVCSICTHPSERLDPLSVEEMNNRVREENIPVAVYQARWKKIAIIRSEDTGAPVKVDLESLKQTGNRCKELLKTIKEKMV